MNTRSRKSRHLTSLLTSMDLLTMTGGWSATRDATKETQEICDQVKPQVEKKTGKNYREFKAVKYRIQIVAGANYVIKVHVGGDDYIQLSLFQQLLCYGGKVLLHDVQNTTKDHPLTLPNSSNNPCQQLKQAASSY